MKPALPVAGVRELPQCISGPVLLFLRNLTALLAEVVVCAFCVVFRIFFLMVCTVTFT